MPVAVDPAPIARQYGVTLIPIGGGEHKACCPFHNEKSPSFRVYADHYHCFGCGAHGDAIDLARELGKMSYHDAKAAIGDADPNFRRTDPYAGIRPAGEPRFIPRPGAEFRAWNPKLDDAGRSKGWTTYRPQAVYPYRSAAGALLGVVLRVQTAGGKKLTPWLQFARWPVKPEAGAPLRETPGWCHTVPARPRALYGLDLLARRPQEGVILVEGEKCADWLRKFGFLAIAWSGGTNCAHLADWSPLAGRRVLCWPDADEVGLEAMEWAACLAEEAGARKPRVCYPEPDRPKGWDCADAVGWSRQDFVRWMQQRADQAATLQPARVAAPTQATRDVAA